MNAHDLLVDLTRQGVEIGVSDGGKLRVDAPKGLLSPDVLAALREHKPALLELLGDVRWRADAMRRQVPDRGPIPYLLARPEALAEERPEHCLTCGDPLPTGRRYRCGPCVAAVWVALAGREPRA